MASTEAEATGVAEQVAELKDTVNTMASVMLELVQHKADERAADATGDDEGLESGSRAEEWAARLQSARKPTDEEAKAEEKLEEQQTVPQYVHNGLNDLSPGTATGVTSQAVSLTASVPLRDLDSDHYDLEITGGDLPDAQNWGPKSRGNGEKAIYAQQILLSKLQMLADASTTHPSPLSVTAVLIDKETKKETVLPSGASLSSGAGVHRKQEAGAVLSRTPTTAFQIVANSGMPEEVLASCVRLRDPEKFGTTFIKEESEDPWASLDFGVSEPVVDPKYGPVVVVDGDHPVIDMMARRNKQMREYGVYTHDGHSRAPPKAPEGANVERPRIGEVGTVKYSVLKPHFTAARRELRGQQAAVPFINFNKQKLVLRMRRADRADTRNLGDISAADVALVPGLSFADLDEDTKVTFSLKAGVVYSLISGLPEKEYKFDAEAEAEAAPAVKSGKGKGRSRNGESQEQRRARKAKAKEAKQAKTRGEMTSAARSTRSAEDEALAAEVDARLGLKAKPAGDDDKFLDW